MSVIFIRDHERLDSGACFRNLNLLAHSQMIELFIGSECGGHGKCGRDRVILNQVDQAQVNPPTEIEKAHLTQKEFDLGLRLACQCFPENDDLKIEVTLPHLRDRSTPRP
jgi:ferredoxin